MTYPTITIQHNTIILKVIYLPYFTNITRKLFLILGHKKNNQTKTYKLFQDFVKENLMMKFDKDKDDYEMYFTSSISIDEDKTIEKIFKLFFNGNPCDIEIDYLSTTNYTTIINGVKDCTSKINSEEKSFFVNHMITTT
jgi:hypothetical protein